MVNSSLARSFRGMVFGGAASVGLMASPGSATTLTFEGLKNGEPIDNYYDSGSGGSGSGPGPNYGVTFTSNSLAFISKSAGGTGNFVNSPPPGNTAALFTGSGDYMNVPAGFMTSLSFYYDGAQSGSVTVYSGLDGAGSPLLNLTLLPDTSFLPPLAVSFPEPRNRSTSAAPSTKSISTTSRSAQGSWLCRSRPR